MVLLNSESRCGRLGGGWDGCWLVLNSRGRGCVIVGGGGYVKLVRVGCSFRFLCRIHCFHFRFQFTVKILVGILSSTFLFVPVVSLSTSLCVFVLYQDKDISCTESCSLSSCLLTLVFRKEGVFFGGIACIL